MRTTRIAAIVITLCLALMGSVFAQNASSKATAAVNTLVKCNMTAVNSPEDPTLLPGSCVDLWTGASVATKGQWIEIMAKPVKLSNSQSLFVSPSLVSGLYTQTQTRTKVGTTSTAQAEGAVYLRAVLTPAGGAADGSDDILAAPLNLCHSALLGCANPSNGWGVVLDSRIQTLSQTISACTVLVDSGSTGACDFTSTIDFILQTASANTFNFIFPNVGQGTYTVKIYAAVGSGATIIAGDGLAIGAAAFGLGSMTVESVRLVHNFEF